MQKIIAAIMAFIMQLAAIFGFSVGGGKTPETPQPDLIEDDQIVSVIVELDRAGLLEGITSAKQRQELVENIETNPVYDEIKQEQETIIDKIKDKFAAAIFDNSFSYSFVMNGFSLQIPFNYLNDLLTLPGVKAVTVAGEYDEPDDMAEVEDLENFLIDFNFKETANESDYLTGVLDARDKGYDGRGTVIAIIDTGFEISHEAFSNDVINPTLSKKDINKKTAFGFLNTIVPRFGAHWYSEKIPYKWDYSKYPDKDVFNKNSDHGTHVAGIAAGKSDVMTGVAPEAQLLCMKVFGDEEDSKAKEPCILAALDDTVKLGADVVNLSLGTRSGQEPDNIFTNDVIQRLKKAGVAVCGSAGNEASLSSFDRVSGDNMNIELFDYGTTGSPASYSPLLSVASTAISGTVSSAQDVISYKGIGSVTMSSFSSWGPTADLRLKPEISCPGSNIYSSVPGNSYDYMSGTSMASPFYTGSVAIMKQYVRERFPKMKDREMAEFIHSILMSTARPFKSPYNTYCYSPRQQGAGFIDLAAAISTPAYLTQSDGVSRPKIELYENSNGVLDFSFEIHNFSDSALTYDLSELVLVDNYKVTYDGYVNSLQPKKLFAPDSYATEFLGGVDENNQVTVAPGSTEKIKMKITVSKDFLDSNSEKFVNGFYIDGFVYLKDSEGNNPTLSIPFLTFYGDWDQDILFDRTIYDEEPSYLRGEWGLMVTDGKDYYPLGVNIFESGNEYNIDSKYCAYSKNALSMKKPYITAGIGLLRNCKRMDFNLFTKSGIFRYCGSTLLDYCRKTISTSTVEHGVLWGGKSGLINGNEYVYKVSAKPMSFSGSKHTVSMPFVVDNDRPSIESCKYEIVDGKASLEISIKDNHYVMGFQLFDEDDRSIGSVSFKGMEPDKDGVYTYSCDLNELARYRDFSKIPTMKIYTLDYAYNEVFGSVDRVGETTSVVIDPTDNFAPTEILKARAYNFPENTFVMEEENLF